ncbi:hypothetical protein D3C81_1351010 [compost metagenome]
MNTQSNPFLPLYTYGAFVDDVLAYGAVFACRCAHDLGISGAVQATWLARLCPTGMAATIGQIEARYPATAEPAFPTIGNGANRQRGNIEPELLGALVAAAIVGISVAGGLILAHYFPMGA